jgi:hypothetical protein
MSPETLQEDITRATVTLIKMAREHAWNSIPDNCLYILNESDETSGNIYERYAIRKLNNDKKKPLSLNGLMPELLKLYPNLHEIDLFVYKAFKSFTIIEIQYIIHNPICTEFPDPAGPMLHCKVPIPLYSHNKNQKFDINWPLNTFQHRWKMFWYRLKFRLKN